MTSPHVSEQEVEAAARVIAELCTNGIIDAPQLPWPCWMGSARSILTAAAQVKERAAIDVALQHRAEFLRVRAEIPPELIDCLLTGGKRCPDETSCSRCHTVVAMWLDGGRERYAAAEPDSGPDVLGERKGIIGNFDEK